MGRVATRFDHQAEICAAYGYRPFDTAGVEREFVSWLQARAWVGAESQRALFARAAEHLIGLRVLLPGHSTLWRLVASARERADARGYSMLTEPVTDGQRDRLLELLRTPAGRRLSTLERLRRPIVDPSIKGLIGGLERERELRVLADGSRRAGRAAGRATADADGRRRAPACRGHREDGRAATAGNTDRVRDHSLGAWPG